MLAIPGTHRYTIGLLSRTIYKDGIIVESDKQDKYTVTFDYITISRDIYWYINLTKLNFELPEKLLYGIKFLEFKPYKPFGISKDLAVMPVFTKPIELDINGEVYRVLARYPDYAINKTGKIHPINNNVRYRLYSCNKSNNYESVSLYDRYFRSYKQRYTL